MTTAQVLERVVTVNNNSLIQDYIHPDDQTQPTFNARIITLYQVKKGTIKDKRFMPASSLRIIWDRLDLLISLFEGPDLGHSPLLYVLKSSCLQRSVTLAYGVNKSTIMYSSCYIYHNNK